MKLGIVGLPNVGKSTLFNAITNAGAESANYPFCTIDPNVGIVPVPDHRLTELTKIHNPKKTTPAVIEFVDIAGLVRGASKGEGLGNKFLAHIREVDAIVHVVRCFEDANIVHVEGSIDPVRDMETINLELILADMEMVEKRLDKATRMSKGNKAMDFEIKLLTRVKEALDAGLPARSLDYNEEEEALMSQIFLLTTKPVIYAANMDERAFQNYEENNPFYHKLLEQAAKENASVLPICAQLEQDISELEEEEEKTLFLAEIGLEQSGLDRLVTASYGLLGLISYLTAGPDEVRAWTITRGTKAPQAAGKIHSDFERGFIRAEVVSYQDFMDCGGSMVKVKEKGQLRSEGKEYVVQDGDIVLFRFNV